MADLNKLTGNADTWANTALANGIPVGTVPKVGAIGQKVSQVVNPDGSNSTVGHVAVVERVNTDGSILISESSYYTDQKNHTGDFLWKTRTIAASSVAASYFQKYIYVRS